MEERFGCIEFAEDVMVFIERSPMADQDVFVDDHRSLLQLAEITHVLFGDVISCPVNGRGSDRIECLHCVKPADGFVVIPPDRGYGLEEADSLDDLIRGCTITDQVSKKEVMVDFAVLCKLEEGQEGFHVAVNIRKNEISHG